MEPLPAQLTNLVNYKHMKEHLELLKCIPIILMKSRQTFLVLLIRNFYNSHKNFKADLLYWDY